MEQRWTDRLPEDFFRDESERWVLKLSEGELKLKAEDLADIASAMTQREITERVIIGMKARLRRTLGEDLVPLDSVLKSKCKTRAEQRMKKAKKAVKFPPLPFKKFDIRGASSPKSREYMFSYGIVRQMYKNYLAKEDTLERYKEAREWFHSKYGE